MNYNYELIAKIMLGGLALGVALAVFWLIYWLVKK